MSAGKSSLWKTILLPPLFALLLYLLTINILLPLYQRLRSRHPSSSLPSRLPSWLSLNRLSSLNRRRNSTASSGDEEEELEEGLLDNVRSGRDAGGRDHDGERRLSRELEVGFRDESDEEEQEEEEEGELRGRRGRR